MYRMIARVAVLVVSSAGITAQGVVWVVDDDVSTAPDFTDLQAAIDTVASGDVLLVKPGSYGPMDIAGKSLTVVADVGGSVDVGQGSGRNRISEVPDGGTVQLRGLTLSASHDALNIVDCQGTVWVEDCRCRGAGPSDAGISVQNSRSVVLIDSTATGGNGESCGSGSAGSGLEILLGSSVHSYGCSFRGGAGGSYFDEVFGCYPPASGGEGVSSEHAQNFLFFSDCSVRGGSGGGCNYELFGCFCGSGGIGLLAGGSVYVLDSDLQASLGNGDPECGGGYDGPASLGPLTRLPGHALRVTTSPSPVREDVPFEIVVQGPPRVPVWMVVASEPDTVARLDAKGTLLFPPFPLPITRFLGRTDSDGRLSVSLCHCPMPAGAEAVISFRQFLYLESPDVPGAPPVLAYPRTYVLGQGTMIVALDESF